MVLIDLIHLGVLSRRDDILDGLLRLKVLPLKYHSQFVLEYLTYLTCKYDVM